MDCQSKFCSKRFKTCSAPTKCLFCFILDAARTEVSGFGQIPSGTGGQLPDMLSGIHCPHRSAEEQGSAAVISVGCLPCCPVSLDDSSLTEQSGKTSWRSLLSEITGKHRWRALFCRTGRHLNSQLASCQTHLGANSSTCCKGGNG